jgi:hypothetical protein
MIVQRPSGFIEPCLPLKAVQPPSGPLWVHEIKHDGYRLMVRRDGARNPPLHAQRLMTGLMTGRTASRDGAGDGAVRFT